MTADKLQPIDIARASWGVPAPDWIEVLAGKCAEMTQRQVAARIGYSGGMVSQLLRNRYRGNLDAIEEAVRGAWMGATVTCPVMGTLASDACQEWRRKSKVTVPSNRFRIRMQRACARCPRNQKESEA